jgi:mevalonate pyrophosphate decarboxylase
MEIKQPRLFEMNAGTSAADAGFAGVGRCGQDRKTNRSKSSWPASAGRTSSGSGAYRDRTGDLRLAKPALSQLS